MDVFEALYQMSNIPTWLGWAFGTGGCCALSWLKGFNRGYDIGAALPPAERRQGTTPGTTRRHERNRTCENSSRGSSPPWR